MALVALKLNKSRMCVALSRKEIEYEREKHCRECIHNWNQKAWFRICLLKVDNLCTGSGGEHTRELNIYR